MTNEKAPERIYMHPTSAEANVNPWPLEPGEYVEYVRGDLVSPASAAPVVDEYPPRRLIGSSRHPHFTAADHERMKETLDALSDYPTEEEAEAVLQACGTSGKEVVNEFIERLLKENLELKNKLATAAPVEQSDSLLTQIATIADLGSAAEFGDALERLRSIRKLINEHEGAR